MNHKKIVLQIVGIICTIVLLAACTESQATPTPMPPTLTPIPPTATAAPTATVALSPEEIASLSPSPRSYMTMAYDAESDRIILFGGQTGNILAKNSPHFNDETWAYDVAANKWTEMKPPSGPTGRSPAELVYDAESDRVILVSGANEEIVGTDDTWAYDYNTNTWTEMAKGPAGHLGPRLAYDAESDRIIFFGGFFNNDTWAYDFNSDTWTEMSPSTSPPRRNYQAMAYDPTSDRVLMWGGLEGGLRPVDESVWAYDFNTNVWQEFKPGEGSRPSARDYPAMVYDTESDKMILFGGLPSVPFGGDDTWTYDYNTNTWTELKPNTVPGRISKHALTYSTAADRVILFGGYKIGPPKLVYSAETWSYDLNSNTWTNVTPQP